MDARLAALEDAAAELRAHAAELREALGALREEGAALRECLEAAGVLGAGCVREAVLRRAAASRRRALLAEVVGAPGAADALAWVSGVPSAASLATTCRAFSKSLLVAVDGLARAHEDGPLPSVVVIGGADGDDEGFSCLTAVEAYNPLAGTWTALPPMPNPRTRCAAAATKSHLYVIGGYGKLADEPIARGMPISIMQRFDPVTNRWEDMPELGLLPMTQIPTAAAGFGCGDGVHYADSFYVVSGRNCEMVERFYPASGAWEALPPRAPMAKGAGCCAVVLNGMLYVTGGEELRDSPPNASGTSCTQVHRFDPATRAWSATPPMRTPRIQVAAAALGGLLYVVGGRSCNTPEPLAAAETYNPETGEWRQLPEMPTARAFCSAVAVLGSLLVIGGRAGGSRLSVVEVYDPESCSWASLPPMPTQRSGCAAIAVPL